MPASSTTDVERAVELVFQFVEEVREEYAIGMQELLTVQRLLVELAARSALPANPLELEGYLRPILCSNRREHQGFSESYRSFLQRTLPSATPIAPAPAHSVQSRLVDFRLQKFLLGAALTALVIVAAIGLVRQFYTKLNQDHLSGRATAGAAGSSAGVGGDSNTAGGGDGVAGAGSGGISASENALGGSTPGNVAGATSEAPPSVVVPSQGLSAAQWGALLLVLAAAAWAALSSWFKSRADVIISGAADQQPIDAESVLLALPHACLASAPVLRRTSAVMRARQAAQAFELDVLATVRATARQAGFFTAVKRELTSVPEYLFLLERRHPHDLDCARQDDLLDQLEQSGVKLVRFYFTHDASIVNPRDPLQRPRALREVEAAYHAHRLVVVAERDSLLDPVTADLAPWAADLAARTKPVLLTSSNLDPLLPVTQKLRAAGFRLVEASATGLSTVFGSRQNSPAREQAGQGLVLPSLLGGDRRRWLGQLAPEPDLVERCLTQLRLYLGNDGYHWLCACALYPQLRWPLVMALAQELEIGPLGESDLVRRLTSLPWMRAARMPAWLRRRLLDDLPTADKERVQRAVERILVGAALPGEASTLPLRDPGQVHLLYRELSRRWDDSPSLPSPNDDALYWGTTGDALALRLPRALGRLRAAMRRRVDGGATRGFLQATYGALGVGYVLQLIATALPGSRPVLTTIALAAGGCWALVAAFPPPWQGIAARLGARSLVVLASLIGAALRHVDFGFGDYLGINNVVLCVECFVVLGLPLALFQRGSVRASTMAILLAASALYKLQVSRIVWDIRLPWLGVDYSGTDLAYREVLALATQLVPGALALALVATLLDTVRATAVRNWWLNTQAVADRLAPDRLLFDAAEAEPLPSGPVATALGAAVFGFVVGAAASFPWDSVVWLRGMLVIVAGLFIAFPHLATTRYQQQQRERSWAVARAAYEYAMVVGVALYVKAPVTNAWLTTAIPVVGMLSLLAAAMARLPASRRLRGLLERAAPDRLLTTSPIFFGLAYCNVLVLLAVRFVHLPTPPTPPPGIPQVSGGAGGNAGASTTAGMGGNGGTAAPAGNAGTGGTEPVAGCTLIIDPRPTLAFSNRRPPMPTKFNLQHGDDPAQLVEAGKPLQLACGRYELTFPRESALLDGQRFIVTLKPGEAYKTPFMIRPFDGQLTVVALFPGTAVLLRGPDGEKSGTTNEAYRVPPGYTTIVASGYQAETVRIASGMAHEVTLKPLPTGTDQSGSPDTKK